MKIIILICVVFLTVSDLFSSYVSKKPQITFTNSSQTKKISDKEAIQIAEAFIVENGYTDLLPTTDKEKIAFESIEWTSNIKEILKSRHNTLEKKAYGILKVRKGNTDGYTVVFRFTNKSITKTGRAVTMDLNGKNIKVEHQDIFLKAIQKKL